ncbi:MAG: hypothetical protein P4L16_08420 [Chlamydiales bacterium]|nr:hypothetical protein [Chlamydiales bacterium]
MSSVISLKKQKKPVLSSAQQVFNRLKRKVEALQEEQKSLVSHLDICLKIYHEKVSPVQQELVLATSEFVKSMYKQCRNLKKLSKKEKELCQDLLLDKIQGLIDLGHYNDLDPEVHAIVKELKGVDLNETMNAEFDLMKKEMSKEFKKRGIDIDLSDMNHKDSMQDIIQKMFESMNASQEYAEEKKTPPKPKSKKQLEKEQKAVELETLQKKSLSTIYKQLARAFHPDLEQDLLLKKEKEEVMKKLTTAYDNKDLHALLLLEFELLKKEDNQGKVYSDDQVKLYNAILKDQVEALKQEVEMIWMHPRYVPMEPYFDTVGFDGPSGLEGIRREKEKEIKYYRFVVNELKGLTASVVVRTLLKEYEAAREIDGIFGDVFF